MLRYLLRYAAAAPLYLICRQEVRRRWEKAGNGEKVSKFVRLDDSFWYLFYEFQSDHGMPSGSIEGRGMQAGNDNGDESGRQDEDVFSLQVTFRNFLPMNPQTIV